MVFMYNTEEPNLFTPEILESIRQVWQYQAHRQHTAEEHARPRSVFQVENILLSDPRYTEFCQLQVAESNSPTNSTCTPPQSMLSLFHGNATLVEGFRDQALTQGGIDIVLRDLSRNLYSYGAFFDKQFSSSNLKSQWTRSIYSLGLPRPGFEASDTRYGKPLQM